MVVDLYMIRKISLAALVPTHGMKERKRTQTMALSTPSSLRIFSPTFAAASRITTSVVALTSADASSLDVSDATLRPTPSFVTRRAPDSGERRESISESTKERGMTRDTHRSAGRRTAIRCDAKFMSADTDDDSEEERTNEWMDDGW